MENVAGTWPERPQQPFGYTTGTVKQIIGQPPIPFVQWARENAAAFQ